MLTFRLLGSIEVLGIRGPVEIRGRFQRILLAALLVNRGKVVSTHALMDELWADSPPRHADNALQAHMSRLRRCLDPAEPGRPVSRFVSTPSGYRLTVDDAEVDADSFVAAINHVRRNDSLDPVEAIHRLRAALSLYHGPVLGGPLGGVICQAAAVRLEEHRGEALAMLYEKELLIGRHAQIIAELSELVESQPLNERLSQQLMVALYRNGRQTTALTVYRRLQTRLVEELGLEPSPTLRQYEWAILSHDPMLDARRDHILAKNR